jgi:hypothetical protein
MAEEEAGIVTGEESEPTPTGTETLTPAAEETAASLESEEGGEPEGEEAEGEEKGRAQERIRQLIDREKEANRRIADLEGKVATVLQEKQTIPAIDERALNDHLGTMRDQIEEMRLNGEHLKADILDRKRNNLIDEYEKWQKTAEEQKGKQTDAQAWDKTLEDLGTTSDMYRDHMKIPAPVWDEMGQWFSAEMKTDRLLEKEFIDILKRNGPVSAIRFAHEKAKPVFEAKAAKLAADKAKKDADKGKQPGGGTGDAGKQSYTSYSQLLNLGSAAITDYKKANPKHYQQLLDKHL